MSVEEVTVRLKVHEERLSGYEDKEEKNSLLLTHEEWLARSWRGCRHGHGRGDRRGRDYTSQTHDNVNQLKDKSMIKCYSCEKYGYYAVECHNKKCDEEANLTFTDNEELVLMLAEKMPNLLILNEEKIMSDLFANG